MTTAVGLRPATARGSVTAALPVVAGALAVLAAATGVALHLSTGSSATGVTDWWLMQTTAALSYATTGAWLARARPGLVTGWLLLGIGSAQAVGLLALEHGVAAHAGGAPGALAVAALWAANWLWAAALVTIGTVLPLLLPEGRLLSPRWRPALALSVAAVISVALSWALTPYESWSPTLAAIGAHNPLGAGWVTEGWVAVPSTLLAVTAVVVAFAGAFARWAASSGEGRDQVAWVLFGGLVTVAVFAAGFALGPVVTALAMVPLPAACVVAVLRHGMWDVDVAISRSLVYGALTACVLGAYAAVVGTLGGLIGPTTGAPILVTALAAVLAEPLLRRLRAAVNRLVYGDREDPYALLGRLGQRLEDARDAASVIDEVLPELVSSVAGALRLPYAAVELGDGGVIAHGRSSGPVESVPLVYGGAAVGRLVLATRPGGLRRRERRVLAGLAEQAGVAVHTVLLTRDLDRSRELLVTAREEERRRLHRELHDGLGPTLAALALQAETARDLVREDPVAAAGLLDRVVPRLRTAVADVRGVVSGLRPPALDELGLAGAVRELASRFAAPGLTVTVRADDVGPLPAAVEVAGYRIAAEALTNAVRHGRPSRVELVLRREPGDLSLSVEDDGCGLPAVPTPGVGMASMRQRAAELGGTFHAGPRTGGPGTRISAALPLEAP
ncbi:sensor histidine kinase [Blastococcus sp. SYSU DS0533]